MDSDTTIVQDLLGNSIRVGEHIKIPSSEFAVPINLVFEQPAIVIETSDGAFVQRHYIRSIDWGILVLVAVELKGVYWEVFDVIHNPTSDYISTLLKRGKQLI